MANPVLKTSSVPFSGGVATNTGTGQIVQLAVQNSPGNWAAGDHYMFLITETLTGVQYQVGSGDVTGLVPTFLLTYKKKLNFLAGTDWFFSAIDLPTTFNDINTAGNGFIELANNFAESEDILSLLPFQGRIAVNGRNNLQLWQVAADPADYDLVQTLPNVPTVAKASVIGIGEMDGLFLADTGVRELRVLSTTLNAETSDVGSPIDLLIQALLLTCSATEKATACGVREPSTGLYWLFIKNTMFVFAYYPSVKILAWSQWQPTYQSTNLSRLSNISGTTYTFKGGYVNNVAKAEVIATLVDGGQVNSVKPYAYLFAVAANGTTFSSTAVTGGTSYRGFTTFDGTWTFLDNQVAFTPQKFVVQGGIVVARTSASVFVYGGSANTTYDNNIAVAQISFLPLDAPGVKKTVFGVDTDISGHWNMFGTTDYLSGLFERLYASNALATYDIGNIAWSSTGTHVQVRMQTTGTAEKCIINGLSIYTRDNDSKGVNR